VPAVTSTAKLKEIIFKGHFAPKKSSKIWVMDPGKGMNYGIMEFYGV
jgi:hypothetical protein